MKKRSMLAIASLATGFVVAAVTPSHSLDGDALNSLSTLDLQDTFSTVDQTISDGSLATDGNSPAQEG
ncbi:hypothetical protein ACH4Y0_21665 [Streptomyces sp. NPDC020707]|jgi:hypothetical protein|uniref:Secreted protein n=1 Tax=Streptomyces ortus TaxID=2867268 RepID=A0ABT3UZ74_9ACTN|nr:MULTISPECIES: hypothetical protein [Streptomyces]MCX4231481.1 hypothetical protein [Streptomyces ortus]